MCVLSYQKCCRRRRRQGTWRRWWRWPGRIAAWWGSRVRTAPAPWSAGAARGWASAAAGAAGAAPPQGLRPPPPSRSPRCRWSSSATPRSTWCRLQHEATNHGVNNAASKQKDFKNLIHFQKIRLWKNQIMNIYFFLLDAKFLVLCGM